MKDKILILRISLLKHLLSLMGFRNIRGHWVYCPGITSNSIVIDLGANTGEFSEQIKLLFGSKCYAIEANKKLFDTISTHTTKMNVAIAKTNGPVNFYLSNNPESGSLVPDFEDKWGTVSEELVEGMNWKSLMEKLDLKDSVIELLKIDVEGAELDLLESFDEKDINRINQITVEFHDWLNERLHARTLSAIKKLVTHGYLCITNTPDHSWPVEAVFLRKENLKFNFIQKILFGAFNRVTFLRY